MTSTLRARLLFVAVLLTAVAAAWVLTRGPSAPAPAAGHQHNAGATTTATGGAMPVTLGAADQRRIGVTFAPVLREPLEREVRTVAQVAYDETRVKTIAPLIEGWIDRLYVNFTGQAVRPGDALFTIYSPMVVSAEQ